MYSPSKDCVIALNPLIPYGNPKTVWFVVFGRLYIMEYSLYRCVGGTIPIVLILTCA